MDCKYNNQTINSSLIQSFTYSIYTGSKQKCVDFIIFDKKSLKTALTFLFISIYSLSFAQVFETPPPDYLKTIIFKSSADEFSGTPILQMRDQLLLKFDDLNASESDYYYEIEHYNFDWTPSDLSKNEYLEGFDDLRILNFQNSLNTLQSFTNYSLRLPNDNTRAFKKTGNYLLKIKNDNDQVVFTRKFIVTNSEVKVKMSVLEDRRLNYSSQKQVINFEIGQDGFFFKNPKQSVKIALIKNNDFSNAIYTLKPQYNQGNTLIYRYNDESAFWGGNEYRNFDSKDIRLGTSQIRSIELTDLYNSYLFEDYDRSTKEYTYNPDINGNFLVNAIQTDNLDKEADYTRVHFNLKTAQDLSDGEVHVYGKFNNYTLNDDTMLERNPRTGEYENSMLFKQGFYNYKYVFWNEDKGFDAIKISGSHTQTENLYTIIVYYKPIGARYDKIIGTGNIISRNIKK